MKKLIFTTFKLILPSLIAFVASVYFYSIQVYAADSIPNAFPVSGIDLLTKKTVAVDIAAKKAVVVVFLSARCPCSNSHVTELKKLSEEYPEFNYVAIHSNTDEDAALSTKYFKEKNFSFPVIQDNDAQLADHYKAYKTPHAFVLNAKGDILYQGGISNSADCQKADRFLLREALVNLHNNEKVKTPEGRTLGCVILRKEKNAF